MTRRPKPVEKPPVKVKRGWVQHRLGCGESFFVANGLYLSVEYSSTRGDPKRYRVRVFGLDFNQGYEEMDEAKKAAELFARSLLSFASISLDKYGVTKR